jgi:hypothetical protein
MKPQTFALLSAAALNCVILTNSLADSAIPRAAIQAAYDQQNKAAETKDVDLFMKTLAPDFTGADKDGKAIPRTQAKQNMVSLFSLATHIVGQTTIQNFTVKAGKAYVTVKEHDTVVVTDPKSQQSATMVDDEVDADVWQQVGGVWKQKSDKVLSERDSTIPGTMLDNSPGQTT